MGTARYLTLLWPGLPWLWLRGSLAGLILALAFALVLDVAVISTWIWSGLVDLEIWLGLWTATAAVWLVATLSALSAFPPPIPAARDQATDALFLKARDAYLARDWLTAEMNLRALLQFSAMDGEAQLLLGTLLRRAGRWQESRKALEKLARSDSGGLWKSAIDRELAYLTAPQPAEPAVALAAAADPAAATLPLNAARTAAVEDGLAA